MKLIWPIKRSFVAYVRGSEGNITLDGGATETTEGFTFPGPEGDEGAFGGSVRFEAHGGMLDVTIANPRFTLQESAGELSVESGDGARVTVARLVDIMGSDVQTARLLITVEGSRLLGDVYAPGSELDPVRLG